MKNNIDPVLKSRLLELASNNLSSPRFREPELNEELEFDSLLAQAKAQGLKLPKSSDLFLDDGCPLCVDLLKQDVVHALGGKKRDPGHIVMPLPVSSSAGSSEMVH
jgi:hypothetical protein